MSSNPYGESCGTSITVPPRNVRTSRNRLGTAGARLSDTASGKAPKRIKSREELEAMSEKAEKCITVIQRPAQPLCTCKECKADEALIMELEQDADDLLAIVRERIKRNTEQEEQSKAQASGQRAQYLRDRGDGDS